MESKICLLTCQPAGVETLKNLILPGVGSFTIVDDQNVNSRDLGNNFFVTEQDIGRNRAEVNHAYSLLNSKAVTQWLMELNPDVQGQAVNDNTANLVKQNS